MTTDPQQEYAEALAAYRSTLARLVEAKKHIPETQRARRRRELREERERLAALPPDPMVLEMIESGRRILLDWAAARLRRGIIGSPEAEAGHKLGDAIACRSNRPNSFLDVRR